MGPSMVPGANSGAYGGPLASPQHLQLGGFEVRITLKVYYQSLANDLGMQEVTWIRGMTIDRVRLHIVAAQSHDSAYDSHTQAQFVRH